MQRKGFTLIELLVIIGIMATMVTVGVVGMNSSRAATRLFGAGRDVMSMIRRARSLALITQQKVTVTYSNASDEGGSYVKVEIEAENDPLKRNQTSGTVYALDGRVLDESEADESESNLEEGDGESLLNVLSPDAIPRDVVDGLKIKVLDETDALNLPENETRKSKISIFSTASPDIGVMDDESDVGKNSDSDLKSGAALATDKPIKVAFAANGTVTPPHRIYLYRENSNPEDGLVIRVDRFGEPICGEVD